MKDMLPHLARGRRSPLSGGPARFSDIVGHGHWGTSCLAGLLLHEWNRQDCCYMNGTQSNSRKMKVVRQMSTSVAVQG